MQELEYDVYLRMIKDLKQVLQAKEEDSKRDARADWQALRDALIDVLYIRLSRYLGDEYKLTCCLREAQRQRLLSESRLAAGDGSEGRVAQSIE